VRLMQDRLLGDRVFSPKDLTDRRPLRVISPVGGYGRLELLMEVSFTAWALPPSAFIALSWLAHHRLGMFKALDTML
jgi:hypothetical protein